MLGIQDLCVQNLPPPRPDLFSLFWIVFGQISSQNLLSSAEVTECQPSDQALSVSFRIASSNIALDEKTSFSITLATIVGLGKVKETVFEVIKCPELKIVIKTLIN